MSQGTPTRYATFGLAEQPEPIRNRLLKKDFFYACQRCGLLYERKALRREPVTRLLVCPNDLDEPTVQDLQNRKLEQLYWDRFDRLGIGGFLQDLP